MKRGALRAFALALGMSALGLVAAARVGAQEPERFALVVGQSAYEEDGWALATPAGDAQRVAAALEAVGFEVELVLDADGETLDGALRDFGARVDAADPSPAAVFYFAGHAARSRGEVYLLPIDLADTSEEIHADALHLDDVLDRLRRASEGKAFAVVDACAPPAAVEAPVESACGPYERRRGRDALLAFSAGAGETALADDGGGLYAAALAEALQLPSLDGAETFANAARRVVAASSGLQNPVIEPGRGGEAFQFVSPSEADFSARVAESIRWDFARREDRPNAYRGYLAAYPDGRFVSDALARIAVAEPPVAQVAEVAEAAPSSERAEEPAADVAGAISDLISSFTGGVAPPPADDAPGKFRPLDPDDLLVMYTTRGRLLIELLPELAPETVARIRELARERYFDGVPFDHVVEGLYAEARLRDEPADGAAAAPQGLVAPASPEPTPVTVADRDRGRVGVYAPGDVGFGFYKGLPIAARSDGEAWFALCPGVAAVGDPEGATADARFYIMLGEAPALDAEAAPWGRVIDGLDLVYDFAPGDALSPAAEPDRMTRVRVASDLSESERADVYEVAGAVLDEAGPGFAEFTASLAQGLGREPRLCEIRLPIVGAPEPDL